MPCVEAGRVSVSLGPCAVLWNQIGNALNCLFEGETRLIACEPVIHLWVYLRQQVVYPKKQICTNKQSSPIKAINTQKRLRQTKDSIFIIIFIFKEWYFRIWILVYLGDRYELSVSGSNSTCPFQRHQQSTELFYIIAIKQKVYVSYGIQVLYYAMNVEYFMLKENGKCKTDLLINSISPDAGQKTFV